MEYVVFEISGKQYLAKPGQIIQVDKIEAEKSLEVDKVLLMVSEGKMELGQPYLTKKIKFDVLGQLRKPKIRVATYKAKANYRRVRGSREVKTQIRLAKETKEAK